jgi:MFS transporter, YNFM family, putative membrane transport protein
MPFEPRRIAVMFCAVCAFLHLYSPQAVLPLVAQEFGVGAATASLIITASTFAVAATAPFTGAVADVLGRKRVIVAAMVLLLVPGVMLPLSGSILELIFWRFVQGLLLPPIFAVTVAYIGDEWPPQQATGVIGSYTSASAVAGFLGRFIPGMLLAYVGWRGGFLALAILTACCLVIVATLLPREKQFVRASTLGASLRQMLAHLRNPKLLATFAVGFGVLFNFIAVFTYMSFHLAGPPFFRSAAFIGSIFVVYLAGAAAAAMTGRMIAAIGRRAFVLWALAAWACGILLMLVPSVPVIVLALAIASICGTLAQAASTSYVAITAQGGTSSAVGLYVTAFYVGGTAGGWLAGLAYEAGGWPATLALVLGMLAIMATIIATCWSR